MQKHYLNIHEFAAAAKEKLEPFNYAYLTGGSDDMRTVSRNETAFRAIQIRPRVLVDVREVDTSVTLFGRRWPSPVALAPVGMQGIFHPDAELATVRAAQSRRRLMMASTVSTRSYTDICAATDTPPWFQLYTTANTAQTERLIARAQSLGAEVLVLTVDVPVMGNREAHGKLLSGTMRQNSSLGNFAGEPAPDFDASITWKILPWLRERCNMRIVIKGIQTTEDALLAIENGADGIIVSNHGGRQLESDMGTIEALPEIVDAVQKRIPVLLDGGIRRGTDVFKALALGADAVCIGRPFCYGLAAEGQAGVEAVLDILQTELERNMRLAGVTSLTGLSGDYVRVL